MPSIFPAHFSRNTFFNYLNTGSVTVVVLVTTPLLTSHLGPVRFGIWALLGAMIPYLELLELGMATATVTYVATHLESGETERVHRIINTSFFVLIVPGLVACAVTAGFAVVLPHVVHVPPRLVGDARTLLLLLALDVAVSIPGDTFGGGLVALQRYDLLNMSLIGVTVAQAVAWVVVLALGGGLVPLGIVTVTIALAGQATRYLMLRHLLPGLTISVRNVERGMIRSFAGLSGWFALNELTSAIMANVDVLIVGVVVNIAAAGIYAVGQRLSSFAVRLVTPALDVFFPYSAQMSGRGDWAAIRAAARAGSRLVVGVAAPACLILSLFARPALLGWVGHGFVRAAPVVALLCASFVVGSLSETGVMVVEGVGEPKIPTIVVTAEMVLHVGLAVVLGRWLGLDGVALGALLATVAGHGVVLLPFVCRRLGFGLGEYLASMARAHLPAAAVAGALGWFLAFGMHGRLLTTHGRTLDLLGVAGAAAVVLLVYLAVFAVTGLDAPERRQILGRLRRSAPGPAAP